MACMHMHAAHYCSMLICIPHLRVIIMTTKTATVINLVNTALGAGMLALPFAFKSQGVVLAISNILFCGMLTVVGLLLQVYISGFIAPGEASFFKACKITYPSLAVVFDLAIALKCVGVCVSYLVIAGELMPLVTSYFGYETTRFTWILLSMVIVTPFSFHKSLSSLKTISIIALSSVVYLLVVVIFHFFIGDTISQRGEISIWHAENAGSVISTTPIIVFAFTCAQNMFSSINEMQDRTVRGYRQVIISSIAISATVYVTIGLTGYLSFGNNVGDNIISMYAPRFTTTLGRFAIVLLVLFSYPLMFHPARVSIENIVNSFMLHATTDEHSLLLAHEYHSQKLHMTITVVALILSFLLALTLKSLNLILSFVGATGATSVSFILPGIFAYTLASTDLENDLVTLNHRQKLLLRFVSFFLFIVGLILAIMAISVNIYRISH